MDRQIGIEGNAANSAAAKAKKVLIEKHRSEYDALVEQFMYEAGYERKTVTHQRWVRTEDK